MINIQQEESQSLQTLKSKSNIFLHPSYQGQKKISTFNRKIKKLSDYGRLIKDYDIRYFVLDLEGMVFFYTADDKYTEKDKRDLKLQELKLIIDKPLLQVDQTQFNWFRGFTLYWNDETFMVIMCQTNIIYQQWLNAFEPLFQQQGLTILNRSLTSYQMPIFYHKNQFIQSTSYQSNPEVENQVEKEEVIEPCAEQFIINHVDTDDKQNEFKEDEINLPIKVAQLKIQIEGSQIKNFGENNLY